MSDESTEYLATGSGVEPPDREQLDLIRGILSDETTWSEPPPEVADRIIATIGAQKEQDAEVESIPPGRGRLAAAALLGVAAVVILVVGLLGLFSRPDEVITMQGTDLQPGATGQASIRETDAGWWIRLDLEDLPSANQGSYYEGWVWNDDGEGVSIGTFHLRGGDESVVLWSGVDPSDYPSIWVTLEAEDGDPSASDQIVMRGRTPG